jgi:hypothetical protein
MIKAKNSWHLCTLHEVSFNQHNLSKGINQCMQHMMNIIKAKRRRIIYPWIPFYMKQIAQCGVHKYILSLHYSDFRIREIYYCVTRRYCQEFITNQGLEMVL